MLFYWNVSCGTLPKTLVIEKKPIYSLPRINFWYFATKPQLILRKVFTLQRTWPLGFQVNMFDGTTCFQILPSDSNPPLCSHFSSLSTSAMVIPAIKALSLLELQKGPTLSQMWCKEGAECTTEPKMWESYTFTKWSWCYTRSSAHLLRLPSAKQHFPSSESSWPVGWGPMGGGREEVETRWQELSWEAASGEATPPASTFRTFLQLWFQSSAYTNQWVR